MNLYAGMNCANDENALGRYITGIIPPPSTVIRSMAILEKKQ